MCRPQFVVIVCIQTLLHLFYSWFFIISLYIYIYIYIFIPHLISDLFSKIKTPTQKQY